ncbi:polymorphic toxin type 15 domain-containing protein [Xenorhabdus littoralis]|uniref:polymorphic toxin type 15 domain-containing protein n=1 Tax=Xenorhabdus littoralis TaxID=2582835 RepID=UPI0029E80604|nr:polymorphic toxin type 15 domain-containing protein [Xenorhabdus sp. psl]MDX7993141.1 hypothetical protein [Xenorhabdus sp. psl]
MAKKPKKTPPTVSDKPLLEQKARNDALTGDGNTIGEIVGQPPQVTKVPGEANPVIRANTQNEGGFWNGVKAVGSTVVGVGKGVLKNVGNTLVDVGELAYKGAQYVAASKMEEAAMMQGILGNDSNAKQLRDSANTVRENASNSNLDEFKFTIEGPAEEFGDFIADFNPKGLIKGGAKVVSKVISKGKSKTAAKAGKKADKNTSNTVPKNDKPKENTGKPQEPSEKKGGKVKGAKLTKVPCFNPYNSKRYKRLKTEKERQAFLKEYSAQLRRQQDAINNMSPEEFKIARDAYKKNKRNSLAGKAQEDYRDRTKGNIKDNIFNSLTKKKVPVKEAEKIAQSRADEIFDDLAALHEPDMVAGGYGQYAPKKMGDKGINSAIGGSWNGKRIKSLDDAAKEAIDSGLGDAKMNVQLELCRGKGKK